MKYLKSKNGYRHKTYPDKIFRYDGSAIPCFLNGFGVGVYSSDDNSKFLLKAENHDGVYNKTKIPDCCEKFFDSLDELDDFVDRDVYNDANSLKNLLVKLGV